MNSKNIYKVLPIIFLMSITLFSFQNCSPLSSKLSSNGDNASLESDINGAPIASAPLIDETNSKVTVSSLNQFDRGNEVFIKNCLGCHGSDVETSKKRNISVKRFNFAMSSVKDMSHLKLSEQDKLDVVFALKFDRSKIVTSLKASNQMPNEHISVCKPEKIGSSVMRRLNQREYMNAIKTMFAVDVDRAMLPGDQLSSKGFDTNGEALLLFTGEGLNYITLAQDIAKKVAQSGISFTKCADGSALNASCFKQRIELLLYYVFRRTPTQAEVNKYITLAQDDHNLTGYEKVLSAALVSPHFLFVNHNHKNLSSVNAAKLSQFDLATRLSLFLWSNTPDRTLLDLARDGKLSDKATLDSQMDRMLASPKTNQFINSFTSQWLEINGLNGRQKNGDINLYKSLVPDMIKESQTFFKYILDNNLPVTELVTADYSFINANLAKHYNISRSNLGNEFSKVSYEGRHRRGIITHASNLSKDHKPGTSIITRGANLMEKFLCVSPPSTVTPGNVEELKDEEGVSEFQLVSDHGARPECASCHSFIDPLGQSLVGFNEMGKWIGTEGSNDARSTFPDGSVFNSAFDMMDIVAKRSEFKDCVGEHLAMSAVGRTLTKDESCYVREISLSENKDIGLKDYIKKLITSSILQMEKPN